MAQLIPNIQSQEHHQEFVGRPVEAIQQYYKEQRDNYDEAVGTFGAVHEALQSVPVADLDADKQHHVAVINQTKDKIANIAKDGDFWNKKYKIRQLARETAGQVDLLKNRAKDYKDTVNKLLDRKDLNSEDKDLYLADLKTKYGSFGQDENGNKVLRPIERYEPTKTYTADEIAKGITPKADKLTVSKVGPINVNGKIVPGQVTTEREGVHPKDIKELAKRYSVDQNLINQRNDKAEAYARTGRIGQASKELGISEQDFSNYAHEYMMHNPDATEQDAISNVYKALDQHKNEQELQGILTAKYPEYKNIKQEERPLGEGYGFTGTSSKKVFTSPGGTNVVNTPTIGGDAESKKIAEDYVHYGNGLTFNTEGPLKISGIEYFSPEKGRSAKAITEQDLVTDQVAPIDVAKKDIEGGGFKIPKGQPMNASSITALVKGYHDQIIKDYKKKNKGQEPSEEYVQANVQRQVNSAIQPQNTIFAKLSPPHADYSPLGTGKGEVKETAYIPLSRVKSLIYSQGKFKDADIQPFEELERNLPKESDISSYYEKATGKAATYLHSATPTQVPSAVPAPVEGQKIAIPGF